MGTNQKVTVNGKDYTPNKYSAFILQKIKKDAETYLGTPTKQSIITVPATLMTTNAKQPKTQANRRVRSHAHNQRTNSCMPRLRHRQAEKEMKILVFSFGGGTHDVTVMDFGKGVFQVLSTSETHSLEEQTLIKQS